MLIFELILQVFVGAHLTLVRIGLRWAVCPLPFALLYPPPQTQHTQFCEASSDNEEVLLHHLCNQLLSVFQLGAGSSFTNG